MDNMKKLVQKHSNNLLRKSDINKQTCNCQAKNTYPLDDKCLSSNIGDSAEVPIGNNQQGDKYFVSVRENSSSDWVTLKIHLKTGKKKKTLNFLNIWDLLDKNITNYSIKRSMVKQICGYKSVTNPCNLCL